MITGSRLGASLIVLFIGFIYVLRGRDRVTSLSMGLLSLVVTGSTYLLALPLGLALLARGALDAVQPALWLNNAEAFTVILTNMAAITAVSILILAISYRPYEEAALAFVGWVMADTRHLAIFMVSIVLTPLVLILL
jgi:voltage-gated potassium channel Kch